MLKVMALHAWPSNLLGLQVCSMCLSWQELHWTSISHILQQVNVFAQIALQRVDRHPRTLGMEKSLLNVLHGSELSAGIVNVVWRS